MNYPSIIIETNKDVVPFVKEIGAFITGCCSKDFKGAKEASMYLDIHDRMENVIYLLGKDSEASPAAPFITKNLFDNGYKFFYRKGEEKEARVHYEEKCHEKNQKEQDNLEHQRKFGLDYKTYYAESRLLKGKLNAMLAEPLPKESAYTSVILCFSGRIGKDTIPFIEERANLFAEYYGQGLIILGVETMYMPKFA